MVVRVAENYGWAETLGSSLLQVLTHNGKQPGRNSMQPIS